MSQIAQQDHIIIKCASSLQEQTDEVKKTLRRHYVRGTLMDCLLYFPVEEGGYEIARIINISVDDSGNTEYLYVQVCSYVSGGVFDIECGYITDEDYSDDIPADE